MNDNESTSETRMRSGDVVTDVQPWVEDRVRYYVGNEPPQQAVIIALHHRTDAGIRIVTGPQAGLEVIAPWGVIEPIESGWHPYDPNDLSTHPEEASKVEFQFADGRVFTGMYSRALGIFAHTYTIPEETLKLQKRWRYVEN